MSVGETIIVTGGAGFIGANFIHEWFVVEPTQLVNLDALTYAGHSESLETLGTEPRYHFVHADIGDCDATRDLLERWQPRAIVNFAAESHVDRSIGAPAEFVRTNVLGLVLLLEETRRYWNGLSESAQSAFRFLHVSTDEVYGTLGPGDPAFREETAYEPSSPYAASKASSDHFVRAYHRTYGLPTLTTNCSNNYGPYQYPEKLIPLTIFNALRGLPIPIYGDGNQVRDWLFVADHCEAIRLVLRSGRPGETYNVGGGNQPTNLEVVRTLCSLLDEMRPARTAYAEQIQFVRDRPGHDRRYAVNHDRITTELGWRPRESLESGLRRTVRWYLDNPEWVAKVTGAAFHDWVAAQYR